MSLIYPYIDPEKITVEPFIEIEDFTSEEYWPEWQTINQNTGEKIIVKALDLRDAINRIQGHPNYNPWPAWHARIAEPDWLARPARTLDAYIDRNLDGHF